MTSVEQQFEVVKNASEIFAQLDTRTTNQTLLAVANAIDENIDILLAANQKDLDLMDKADPKYDRLQLTEQRVRSIAAEMRNVAGLANPVGQVLESKQLPNKMHISKIRVPLGVVGIIYEARPNVTFDVFSLCFKTGNAVVLKGGSDAYFSNQAIVLLIQHVLKENNINPNVILLLPPDRDTTKQMLNASKYIDVIIPRGSQGLIDFVRDNSKVPVIETGAGIVHVFADESANINWLKDIVCNAKTRRPSVCNSLDCLVLHQGLLPQLATIVLPLACKEVVLFADGPAYQQLDGAYPAHLLQRATQQHFGTEFLSLKMAIKTVQDIDEALNHIRQYGSKHSESIVSSHAHNIEKFLNRVDAAAVYANASTAFTDGAQFGLGAEIGISTQKLHARGPMGLAELTSYKWIVRGHGQIRDN